MKSMAERDWKGKALLCVCGGRTYGSLGGDEEEGLEAEGVEGGEVAAAEGDVELAGEDAEEVGEQLVDGGDGEEDGEEPGGVAEEGREEDGQDPDQPPHEQPVQPLLRPLRAPTSPHAQAPAPTMPGKGQCIKGQGPGPGRTLGREERRGGSGP